MSDTLKNAGVDTLPRGFQWKISRFDRTVITVINLLLVVLLITVIVGDRVGVQLVGAAPIGTASSSAIISIQFAEDMNRVSVDTRLRLEPPVQGQFRWNARTLYFEPYAPLTPGQTYTVILERGSQSDSGREVLSEYRFSFTVRTARVAYLYPANSSPQNIWIADPANPDGAQQVTFSSEGIYDYSVSSDGTRIAFSETNPVTDTSEIKILDLASGALQQVTNCTADDAFCSNPVWRPDGNMLAFQRIDYNSDLASVGVGPTRVWLLDLTANPLAPYPLFSDSQILGYDPQWSGDGQRIAVFDTASRGILVYNFADEGITAIPSQYGSVGALSPSGEQLVFPEMVLDGTMTRSFLRIANFSTRQFESLTNAEQPIDDSASLAWHPDNVRLALGRRYLDDRYTRGYQVFLLNTVDGSVTQLVYDVRYTNGSFSWEPTGTQLLMQRFPELDENGNPNPDGRPEIWVYNLETTELTLVATNAYRPRWVP